MRLRRVLITGVSRGIGKSVAEYLIKENKYEIIGTSRNIDNVHDKIKGVNYTELDLRNDKSINNCINTAGDIDILINNAGTVQLGSVEEIPLEKIRDLFETNFFGTVKLTSAFIKQMRMRREGYIINIGSMADKLALPFISGYVASKAALAGFTLSLRKELIEFGIKVILIEPSDIKTSMNPEIYIKTNSVYEKKALRIKELEEQNMAKAPDPKIVASLISKIINKENPRPVYSIGYIHNYLQFLIRILPSTILEKIILKYS
jgi:short-subunit dehydrogenase